MNIELDTKDIEEFIDELPKVIPAYRLAFASEFHNKISRYPQATSANRPRGKGKSHYKRGTGTIYERVKGGVSTYKTSQAMNRKWDIVELGNRVVVRNTATYSGYLHFDSPDDKMPVKWAKERGWKQDTDVIGAIDKSGLFDTIARKVLGV